MTRAAALASNHPGFTANGEDVEGTFAGLPIVIHAPAKGATEVTIGAHTYPCSARVTDAADRRKPRPLADRVRDTLTNAEPGTIATVRKTISDLVFTEQEIARSAARAQIEAAQGALANLDAERLEINAILSGAQSFDAVE